MVGVATILYLLKARTTADAPAKPSGGIMQRVPRRATLDRLAHRTMMFGFPIWTFAIIAGAIWADPAWGRYWGWDPKETWSFITWVVYACYLHARATAGWRGRKAAAISLWRSAACCSTSSASTSGSPACTPTPGCRSRGACLSPGGQASSSGP